MRSCVLLASAALAFPLALFNPSGAFAGTPIADSRSEIVTSGLAYSRVTRTFDGTITLKNVDTGPISGPVQIVFVSLPPGVTLANASGHFGQAPYLTLSTANSLMPGEVVSAPVRFQNPSGSKISFTALSYTGSMN
jgi:hypothetical protein